MLFCRSIGIEIECCFAASVRGVLLVGNNVIFAVPFTLLILDLELLLSWN